MSAWAIAGYILTLYLVLLGVVELLADPIRTLAYLVAMALFPVWVIGREVAAIRRQRRALEDARFTLAEATASIARLAEAMRNDLSDLPPTHH